MGEVTKADPLPNFPMASVILQEGHRAASRLWASKEGRHRFRKKDAFSFIQK